MDIVDIKKILGKRIALYERRVEKLQEEYLMIPEEVRDKSSVKEEMLKWYYKDEELLEVLREVVLEEGEYDDK